MTPVFSEDPEDAFPAAWLIKPDGQRVPLRRIELEVAPVVHPDAPLPNELRDIPADVARRATFAVPIAPEDKIVDRRVTPGVASAMAAAAQAGDALARVQSALPSAETMSRIDHAAAVLAAVERGGGSAVVSSYPLSPAEVAQLRRDLPRLSPADEAAFAAAARDLPRG